VLSVVQVDWACQTLSQAQRILLVNSASAFARQQAKLWRLPTDPLVATEPSAGHVTDAAEDTQLNALFELQLDLLAQLRQNEPDAYGAKMASATFSYTPDALALTLLAPPPGRRFRLPQHADQLLTWLGAGQLGATVSLYCCCIIIFIEQLFHNVLQITICTVLYIYQVYIC